MTQLTVIPTVRTLTIQRNASTPTGPAGNDLDGSYPNPTVVGILGNPIDDALIDQDRILVYKEDLPAGARWEFAPLPSGTGTVTSITAGTGLTGGTITGIGTIAADFGSTAGKVTEGNDARLSDARTPLSHTHGNITNAGAIGSTANLPIITGASGVLAAGAFGTGANQFCEGNDARLSDARTPTAHKSTHATGGTDALSPGDIGAATDTHGHGQISAVGTIGSTANLPLITRTGGEIITGTFGTAANTFCEGNDARLAPQTITLTGDVTGSGTGSFAATIANDAVTYAKMQNVTATDRLLGRSSAGAGDVEEITCTAAGRAILDDADAAAQRTTLGVPTIYSGSTPPSAGTGVDGDLYFEY